MQLLNYSHVCNQYTNISEHHIILHMFTSFFLLMLDIYTFCRFEKEEGAGRPPCCFMPMGIGPRNCAGLKLAKFMMKMALVSLLRKYRFVKTHLTEDTLHTECLFLVLRITSNVSVELQPRK